MARINKYCIQLEKEKAAAKDSLGESAQEQALSLAKKDQVLYNMRMVCFAIRCEENDVKNYEICVCVHTFLKMAVLLQWWLQILKKVLSLVVLITFCYIRPRMTRVWK